MTSYGKHCASMMSCTATHHGQGEGAVRISAQEVIKGGPQPFKHHAHVAAAVGQRGGSQ